MNRQRYLIILVFGAFLAYFNSFRGSFQFDDYNVIVNNPVVHSWAAWWADAGRGIRPSLKFTYTLNWTSGMGVFGFHLFNIIIHAVNSVLIYVLTRKFLENQSHYALDTPHIIAILAALLFGLHPIQTEAVTYISGRSVSLMSALYLGSLLAYVSGRSGNRKLFLYVLSPLLFILGVATKEVAVTLPLALLLWETTDRWQHFSFRSIIKRQAVHWLLFLLMFFILITHPRYGRLLTFSFELRGFYANLLSQIHGVMYLFSRLFSLTGLNIDPDLPIVAAWSTSLTLEIAFLMLLFFTGIFFLRRKPWLSFGILWFFLHAMFVNIIVPRIDIINERHFYLGGWGVFLVISSAFGVLFNAYAKHKKALLAFAVCIFLLLGGFTIARNNVYRSEIALWEDTALKSPHKARVFNNLGYAYYLSGQYDKAKEAYLKALQLDPLFETARNNLDFMKRAN